MKRVRAGKEVVAQMDVEQDASDLNVLVLSPEYLASAMCRHEMQRATASDKFVAVLRFDCAAPDEVKKTLTRDTAWWLKCYNPFVDLLPTNHPGGKLALLATFLIDNVDNSSYLWHIQRRQIELDMLI